MSTSDKPEAPERHKFSGYKIDKETALALVDAGWTHQAVADNVGCDASNITKLIARVNKNKEPIKRYRDSQADLIDQLSMDLLAKLQYDDIKDIEVNNPNEIKSLVTALAISIDKSQLLKGKATSHISVLSYEHSVKELHVMGDKIEAMEQDIASCTDQDVD